MKTFTIQDAGKWYAVQCRPRQDARAQHELLRQGYEVFRPLARTQSRRSVRIGSFFPGYLFSRATAQAPSFAPLRSTRGVLRLVGWGTVIPTVPEALIEQLRQRMDAFGVVPLEGPRLAPGQRACVVDGPLRGLLGTFQGLSGADRAVVMLTLLGQPRRLVLPTALLQPA
jgi:transcriptional antiterminator RfaH